MVEVNIVYRGALRCEARHGPSGAKLTTDAPVDNMGKGETFSPSDLVATALGSCILTIMGIIAQRMEIDITGSTINVTKDMTAVPTRRIGRLGVNITVPTKLNDEQKQRLINAAHTCPVCKSLHPDIETTVTFNWG